MAREWFEEWFGEAYVQLYPHRDEAEAVRAVHLVVATTGLRPGWPVLDIGCGAGRHLRALRAAGARSVGLDLSLTLLRLAQAEERSPLVRADMRRLPIRPASMALTVNFFTSFGYFATDDEHVHTLAAMAGTVQAGGWLVIDFLNADLVRRTLVPEETTWREGRPVAITRAISPDGRFVRKTIMTPEGQHIERVRLFDVDEIATMLAGAGVQIRHRFGDYDGGALQADSPRVLVMGRVER